MVFYILLFIAGLAALYYGAEWLVRGGARLARSFNVSPLVVGLTVISFGTSAPELVVSVLAALGGQSDVAIGNVVGSNIMNIGLILGITTLIAPIRIETRLLAREVPLMIVVMVAMLVLSLDGVLGRVDGAILLVGFVGYLVLVLRTARTEPAAVGAEYEEFEEAIEAAPRGEPRVWDFVLVVAGLLGLVAGAQMLVTSALFFARAMGISELVIGLTVVAIGTSLPELATSVLATFRGEADIAIGNVVGSNLFNVLAILGTATVLQPIPIAPSLLRFDLPIMIAICGLILPLGILGKRVGRWDGALLLGGYLVYTVLLISRG